MKTQDLFKLRQIKVGNYRRISDAIKEVESHKGDGNTYRINPQAPFLVSKVNAKPVSSEVGGVLDAIA